jgi:hypothetical protein
VQSPTDLQAILRREEDTTIDVNTLVSHRCRPEILLPLYRLLGTWGPADNYHLVLLNLSSAFHRSPHPEHGVPSTSPEISDVMPSSLVAAYENLLVHNLSTIRSVESGLRNVTWLLPGRFEDAEVASEGCEQLFRDIHENATDCVLVYALLSLLSSYHDTLLSHRLPQSLSLPPHPFAKAKPSTPSPHKPSHSAPPLSITAPLLPAPSEHTRYTRYWTTRSSIYRKASRLLSTLSYLELLLEMLVRKRSDRARWRLILFIESIK